MGKVVTKDRTGKETVRVKVKDYEHQVGCRYVTFTYQDGRQELVDIAQVYELMWYPHAD